jgi:hypothetical protein
VSNRICARIAYRFVNQHEKIPIGFSPGIPASARTEQDDLCLGFCFTDSLFDTLKQLFLFHLTTIHWGIVADQDQGVLQCGGKVTSDKVYPLGACAPPSLVSSSSDVPRRKAEETSEVVRQAAKESDRPRIECSLKEMEARWGFVTRTWRKDLMPAAKKAPTRVGVRSSR